MQPAAGASQPRGTGTEVGTRPPPASPSVPPAAAPGGCRGRGSRRNPLRHPLAGSARWRGTARGSRGCVWGGQLLAWGRGLGDEPPGGSPGSSRGCRAHPAGTSPQTPRGRRLPAGTACTLPWGRWHGHPQCRAGGAQRGDSSIWGRPGGEANPLWGCSALTFLLGNMPLLFWRGRHLRGPCQHPELGCGTEGAGWGGLWHPAAPGSQLHHRMGPRGGWWGQEPSPSLSPQFWGQEGEPSWWQRPALGGGGVMGV